MFCFRSICRPSVLIHNLNRTASKLNLFIFDFDETLSVRSSSDIIDELAYDKQKLNIDDINHRYGKLHHCWNIRMNEVHERLVEQGIHSDRLIETFRTIELSPGVHELFRNISINNGRIIIISNAFDLVIKECFQAHQLLPYVHKIESNPVRQIHPKMIIDHYEKPLQTTCKLCEPNLCKGLIMDRYREQNEYDKIIFVGDGDNDVCPALRLNHNDLAFAKYDETHSKIYHMYHMLKHQYSHELKAKLFTWQTMKTVHDLLKQENIIST